MSLRSRVAIAVGAVVFGALAVVAAVVYPVVGANLRGQDDASLVQVAQNAQTIAAKLKQAGTVGQLVPFGSTQLQILPDATVGPSNGFVAVTDRDVQVANGNASPYFRDEAYRDVVYRIYTMQFPGQPGVLVRVARPASDATSTQAALGWLLVALVPIGAVGAALLARLAAGRVLRPVGRLTETVERIRATGDLSAPIETPGHDEISRLGQAFAAMTAALDDSAGAQRRLVADASSPTSNCSLNSRTTPARQRWPRPRWPRPASCGCWSTTWSSSRVTGRPRSTSKMSGWIWSRNESHRGPPGGCQGCGTSSISGRRWSAAIRTRWNGRSETWSTTR